MSADPDPALPAAALVFAGAAIAGSVVAIRDELPGQPRGISVPLRVPAGAAGRWGAGVAAPVAGACHGGHRGGPVTAHRANALTVAVCAGIGVDCILGTAIEPVTYRPRSWSLATRSAIVLNMASSAALILAGWRHWAAARPRPPRTG